jgi:hypothetical protein
MPNRPTRTKVRVQNLPNPKLRDREPEELEEVTRAILDLVGEDQPDVVQVGEEPELGPRPSAVVDPRTLPHLLNVTEAGKLLGCSADGVYARVARGQLTGVDGLVRTGRKIQFLRDKLLAALERIALRGGR